MSSTTPPNPSHAIWPTEIRRVRQRINRGHYLDALYPLLWWVLVAVALLVILQRVTGTSPLALIGLGTTVAILGILLLAHHRARPKYFDDESTVVWLEDQNRLEGNLLMAWQRGDGDWPSESPRPIQWRLHAESRTLGHCLPAILAVLIACWIPLPGASASPTNPERAPLQSWQTSEDWLSELEEVEILEEETVLQLREQLEALRDLPPEEWYSHRSLEAGAEFQQRLEQAIRELEQNTGQMLDLLDLAENFWDQLPQSLQDQFRDEFSEALEGLDLQSLKLSPEMLQQLGDLDLSQLAQLDPDQMRELREKLAEAQGTCQACLNPGSGGEGDGEARMAQLGEGDGENGEALALAMAEGEERLAAMIAALREGQQAAASGNMIVPPAPGTGAIGTGDTGPTPLTFGEESQASVGALEGVTGDQDAALSIGERLGTRQGGDPTSDEAPVLNQATAGASHLGTGGGEVSRDRLRPDEAGFLREALR